MRGDYFTSTEADAGEYERHWAEPDDDRPSLSDLADSQDAVEVVGDLIADYRDHFPRTVDDADSYEVADLVLTFIRDAIHSDEEVATVIREALGLVRTAHLEIPPGP